MFGLVMRMAAAETKMIVNSPSRPMHVRRSSRIPRVIWTLTVSSHEEFSLGKSFSRQYRNSSLEFEDWEVRYQGNFP